MTPDTVFITLMLLCALSLAFIGGRIFQQAKDRRMTPEPLPADVYPEIRYDIRAEEEVRQEVVDTMSLQIVSFAPTLAVLGLEPAPVDSPLLAIEAARDRYKARFERADRLRARYLRLLRATRARNTYFMSDFLDAPRRPTKAKLAAVILDLPRGNHLRLVPPAIANGWAAA